MKKIFMIGVLLLTAALICSCPKPNEDPYVSGGSLGKLTMIYDNHNGHPYIGGRITFDTSELLGGESTPYFWIIEVDGDGNEMESAYEVESDFYEIKAADHGKRLKARVARWDWFETDEYVDSENTIGPVANGWMVKTISKYVQESGYTNTDRTMNNARGMVIGNGDDNNLYVTANVRWGGGRRILTIDPAGTPNADGLIPAVYHPAGANYGITDGNNANYTGSFNNLISNIAIGPDGSFYVPADRSDMPSGYNNGNNNPAATVLRFPSTGGPLADWNSGNIFDYIRAHDTNGDHYYPQNPDNMHRIESAYANMAVDASGNVYITTSQWNIKNTPTDPSSGDVPSSRRTTIVKIQPDGTAERFAGGIQGYAEGQRLNAQFSYDFGGITIGHDNNLYVADGRNDGRIRKIDVTSGEVATFVGGTYQNPFALMGGITYGKDGNYYVTDRYQDGEWWPQIWKITQAGEYSRIAGRTGGGKTSSALENMRDGFALTEATFHRPWGIAAAADGTVYVLDNVATGDSDNPGAWVRMIYFDNE